MSSISRKIVFSIILFFTFAFSSGQNIKFEFRGPTIVAAGEVFRIEFSINAVPESIEPLRSIEGFDILAGPTPFTNYQHVSINGQESESVTYSSTYVIMADTPGKFTIPAINAVVDGKTYTSRPTPIEVIDAGATPPGAQQGQQSGAGQETGPAATIGADDIIVRIITDKTEVYKGEPVRVSFKLYTKVALSRIENASFPAFNGFWTQELNVDHYTWQRENYRNQIYEARIIKEFLIFPQQSGVLSIDQLQLSLIAQIVTQARRQSLLDEFFGGGPSIQEVKREVSADSVRITVKDLPAGAPASFNGAVGEFTMDADLPSSTIAVNSSAAYTVKISGSGNLPLISAPRLDMPASFEQYSNTMNENLSRSTGGISGYRQYEYPFVARAEGEFNINPVEFTYFNPRTGRYVTLSTRETVINVVPDSTGRGNNSPGMVTGLTKEDLKILGQDIRFIKIGKPGLVASGSLFILSGGYCLILLLLLAAFILMQIYMQKRIKEMRNIAAVRGKKANKVALQRLNSAHGFMKEGAQRKFYEEMLRALWGYMSDKLNIPGSILTKENVREELQKRNVSAEIIKRYIDVITECEYAQYSPAESLQMQDVYVSAVDTISKLESVIKK